MALRILAGRMSVASGRGGPAPHWYVMGARLFAKSRESDTPVRPTKAHHHRHLVIKICA
jgi:hypothetical protein